MDVITSEKSGHVLTFNEKTHRYYCDDKSIPGVTGTNKQGFPTSVMLIGWQIGQGAKYAIDEVKALIKGKKKLTQKVIKNIIKSSKTASLRVAQVSADIGTVVHDYVYCDAQKLPFDMSIIDNHVDKEKINKCLKSYYDWKATVNDEVESAEQIVASVKHWYAGKYDRVAIRDGKRILQDFKTSSYFFIDQFIQLSAYKMAIEEWLGLKIDGLEVIRFGKDGSFDTKMIEAEKIPFYEEQFIRNLKTSQFRKTYEKDYK
ncbi:MAG: hypothetical protein KAS32_24750 [Candidatus Peribacteraceae bacterium]|nr:hypothetical protein [Candidatus Peribacteraceae bacterium]